VSQLESSSAQLTSFRLGTAAARVVRRLQPFQFLSLPMPGPCPPEGAGAGAGAPASGTVPNVPAAWGLALPPPGVSALVALHLACSSMLRILHSAGE